MNKKGFTLMELLAVIVILALLAIVAYPNVARLINNAKNNVEEIQYSALLKVAQTYVSKHAATLGDNETICISDLKKDGLLEDKTIVDPKTDEEYNGCFQITWDTENNQYDYVYNK